MVLSTTDSGISPSGDAPPRHRSNHRAARACRAVGNSSLLNMSHYQLRETAKTELPAHDVPSRGSRRISLILANDLAKGSSLAKNLRRPARSPATQLGMRGTLQSPARQVGQFTSASALSRISALLNPAMTCSVSSEISKFL